MRSNTPVLVFGRVFPLLLIFLMLGEVQLLSQKSRSPEDDQTLRVSVDLVNVLFTVTDGNGRLVTNLNRDDFLVEEDGKKQQISYFSKEVTLPLTLAILIDTSPSVEPILGVEKETAIEFLQTVL